MTQSPSARPRSCGWWGAEMDDTIPDLPESSCEGAWVPSRCASGCRQYFTDDWCQPVVPVRNGFVGDRMEFFWYYDGSESWISSWGLSRPQKYPQPDILPSDLCAVVGESAKIAVQRGTAYRCPIPSAGIGTARAWIGQVLSFAPCDDACATCAHCGQSLDLHTAEAEIARVDG